MNRWIGLSMAAGCLAALSAMASADTVAGLYAGAGFWRAGPDGNIGATSAAIDTLGLSSEGNGFVYVAVEHPIPLWPNVRLQHTRLASEGEGTLSARFRLDEVEFAAQERISTDLDLTHTDAVLYYELLDNLVNLDLGLTLRVFSGHASVASRSRSLDESIDIDLAIPAAYGRAAVGLPAGFEVSAAAHYVGYSGNSLSDLSAHVAWTYESAIDLGVELGYRRLALEVDDDAQTDVGLGGPYATVTLHF